MDCGEIIQLEFRPGADLRPFAEALLSAAREELEWERQAEKRRHHSQQ